MKEQILDTWEKETKEYWKTFVEQTDYREHQPYCNGFIGFGILKKPENHVKEGVNEIVFMLHLTYKNHRPSEDRKAYTEEEAQNMHRDLGNVLNKLGRIKKQ